MRVLILDTQEIIEIDLDTNREEGDEIVNYDGIETIPELKQAQYLKDVVEYCTKHADELTEGALSELLRVSWGGIFYLYVAIKEDAETWKKYFTDIDSATKRIDDIATTLGVAMVEASNQAGIPIGQRDTYELGRVIVDRVLISSYVYLQDTLSQPVEIQKILDSVCAKYIQANKTLDNQSIS